MQIISQVNGQEFEQRIDGLDAEQAKVLAERALAKPETVQIKITRQGRRREERKARKQAKAKRRK